jgi:hypothetical protein
VVQSVSAQSIAPSMSLSSPSRQSSAGTDPLLELELELVCPMEPPCPLLDDVLPPCPLLDEALPPCPLLDAALPPSPPLADPEFVEAPAPAEA